MLSECPAAAFAERNALSAQRTIFRCEGFQRELHNRIRSGRKVCFTALYQRGDPDHRPTFTFNGFFHFIDGQTRSNHVFANQHALSRDNRKAAPPFHSTVHAFRKGNRHAKVLADFMRDQHPARQRSDHKIRARNAKMIREGVSKLLRQLRLLEQSEFFNVHVTVPPAREQKVTFEKGSAFPKQIECEFLIHNVINIEFRRNRLWPGRRSCAKA